MSLSAASETGAKRKVSQIVTKPEKVNRSVVLRTLVHTMCSGKWRACLYVSLSTQTISAVRTECKYVPQCKGVCESVCVCLLYCRTFWYTEIRTRFSFKAKWKRSSHRLHNVSDISSSSWRGFWWLQRRQECRAARELRKSNFGWSGEGFAAREDEERRTENRESV